MFLFCFSFCFVFVCGLVLVSQVLVYGECLEGFDYVYLVYYLDFIFQGQLLSMVYFDVVLKKVNGCIILFMYGKNFCVGIWECIIDVFVDVGYWVIVVDQVGFCKLSKLVYYQYSFQ